MSTPLLEINSHNYLLFICPKLILILSKVACLSRILEFLEQACAQLNQGLLRLRAIDPFGLNSFIRAAISSLSLADLLWLVFSSTMSLLRCDCQNCT